MPTVKPHPCALKTTRVSAARARSFARRERVHARARRSVNVSKHHPSETSFLPHPPPYGAFHPLDTRNMFTKFRPTFQSHPVHAVSRAKGVMTPLAFQGPHYALSGHVASIKVHLQGTCARERGRDTDREKEKRGRKRGRERDRTRGDVFGYARTFVRQINKTESVCAR